MRRYKDWPKREYQFGRLSGKPVIVENWFAMSCVVNASMYSEPLSSPLGRTGKQKAKIPA